MRRGLLALLALALCVSGADRKKPPDVQVIETVARRSEGLVRLDGRVRNAGEKPIQRLVLVFDFMAPGGAVISTQKLPVEEEVLEPGEESVIRAKLADPVRAVQYRVAAVDQLERDLRVANGGPFPIE